MKVFIDIKEFQTKILEFIASDEIDKLFSCTTFTNIPECKQAMIYGMCIASMLTSRCETTVEEISSIKIEK